MTAFLTLLAPILVSGLTQAAKKLIPFVLRLKARWIVVIVAVLSYGLAIIQAAATGGEVDAASIQTLADTLVNLLGATGTYFFAGKVKAWFERI